MLLLLLILSTNHKTPLAPRAAGHRDRFSCRHDHTIRLENRRLRLLPGEIHPHALQ